jgi:hypothetical protein
MVPLLSNPAPSTLLPIPTPEVTTAERVMLNGRGIKEGSGVRAIANAMRSGLYSDDPVIRTNTRSKRISSAIPE